MRSLSWGGLAVTLALAVAMLACDSTERDFSTGSGGGDSGNGGAAGSGGESASSGGGGAGGSECPATHVCVPEVPAGWTGPVTHVLGSSTPECPAEYPTLEADLNADLTVPSSTCSCSCGSPLVTCPTVRHVGYGGVCPKDPQGENTLMNGQCVQTDDTWGFRQSKPSASCGEPVLVEDIPMAGFTNKARICGGGAGAGECSGTGLCAPKPAGDFEKVCVYKSGEEACPEGYPAQVLLHKGLSDTRACQVCSCTPQGAQCTGSITAYQTTTCTGASMAAIVKDTTTIDNPLCVPNNWVSVKYNSTSVNPGTCEVSGGGLEGDVLPADPTTVCCAQ